MTKTILKSRKFPTPFGMINLPRMETPAKGLPELDDRRFDVVKHAVGSDLTGIFRVIPWVGDMVGGQISDLHFAEMKRLMTPQELERFIVADKMVPSNGLALLYSFVKGSLQG